MGLEIKNADYGRSVSGRKKLLADLQSDIDKAIKALTGNEFNSVKSEVSKYWVGEDAEQFKTNLKLSAKELETAFKEYKSKLASALSTDSKQFASMQSKNAAQIKDSRKAIK